MLRNRPKVMRNLLGKQLFRERLSDERSVMPTGQDQKVVWLVTGILHIGVVEIYKFVFLHVMH